MRSDRRDSPLFGRDEGSNHLAVGVDGRGIFFTLVGGGLIGDAEVGGLNGNAEVGVTRPFAGVS